MHLVALFEVLGVALAIQFPPRPIEFSKRRIRKVTVCTDGNLGGNCWTTISKQNQCIGFKHQDKQISSMQIDPGTFCYLFDIRG